MTTANWQEALVKSAAYELASLLMKPGADFLNTLPDFKKFVAWEDTLVLNASLGSIGVDGCYRLRSHYDGRRMSYTVEDIHAIILAVNPDMVIFPEGFLPLHQPLLQSLPDTVFPFLPLQDASNIEGFTKAHGVYFSCDESTMALEELLLLLAQHEAKPSYVAGDLSLPVMLQLLESGVTFVESDRPARDAIDGKVYTEEGSISLKEDEHVMQFEVIDAHCQCLTCNQKLTRAYLHHLLEHTPLLCQRFLVQHNAHFCQNALRRVAPHV